MTAQLAERYSIAGNDNDALVIPAGLAFGSAISKRPDFWSFISRIKVIRLCSGPISVPARFMHRSIRNHLLATHIQPGSIRRLRIFCKQQPGRQCSSILAVRGSPDEMRKYRTESRLGEPKKDGSGVRPRS